MKPHLGHDGTIINGISRIGWMSGGNSARWQDDKMGEHLLNKTISYIKKHADSPFFLYYAPHNAHEPRVPSPAFKNKSKAGIYGDVIEEFDYYVGKIIQTLKETGIYENTIIVLSSDNAPMIKEGYQGSKADFKYDYSVAPKGLTAIWPITAKGKECVWRFKPERLVNDWGKGFIKITESKQKNGNKYSIQYLPIGVISKVETGELKVLGREPGKPTLIFGNNQTVGGQIPTIWLEKDFFTVNGTKTLETMFPDGSPGFNYPKPVELIETIIDAVTESDDLVLDSFAGSGTTAQAVLNLNTKDGGRRKFICIEMMDYAETITAERIKRAIRGFNTQKQDEVLLFSQKISVSNLVKGAELLEMAKKIKEEADESGEFNKAAQIKVKDNQLQVTAQSASKETVSGTGGAFSFYELSYPYIGCDGLLSSEISVSELRDFIWKIETRTPLPRTTGEENGYIGTFNDTAIYLFFDNQHSKVFDRNSLNSMNQKSNNYVVYAESTIFPEEELARRNIVFKKIPRDIPRS